MTAVVNQSLALGQADQMNEPLETHNIRNVLEDIVESYQENGDNVILENGPEAFVKIRPTSLHRALQNLVENALHYGSLVHLSLNDRDGQVQIYVDDDGPGIDESQREEVIKPFVRLETSRNRETGGTGLGLTLAMSLIQQQKGNLDLKESPKGGLRAVLTLPKIQDAPL